MPDNFSFKVTHTLKNKLGRAGVLKTPHGVIETPAFVTVGTKATVKGLSSDAVKDLGAEVVLANTYHLYLQPGEKIVKEAGGLGKFMNWSGPTMTDSGGFQVFSLGAAYGKGISKVTKKNEELLLPEAGNDVDEKEGKPRLVDIDRDGVMFRSHLDGSAHYFTPEKSIEIQHNLGADMIFAFDECTSPTEPLHYQTEALDRTHAWAKRSLVFHHSKNEGKTQALFGIVQGGRHESLRKESAKLLGEMNVEGNYFDGFGIGGSFAKEDMMTSVKWVNEILPEDKPRHLLGIGEPEDLFGAVENGCDLFDCVAPTRNGRNGTLYTSKGKVHIVGARFLSDFSPIDPGCQCYTCTHYTRSYLCHLFKAKEMLAGVLASIHNLYFIVHMVKGMRKALIEGTFGEYKQAFLKEYQSE